MRESDLRKVLSSLGIEVLQRTHSGWLHSNCPFAEWTHRSGSDRRPSFGAKVDEGGISSYHCHSCKMHGRTSSLARMLGHFRHGNNQHYASIIIQADDADRSGLAPGWNDEVEQEEQPPQPIVEEIYENMFELAGDAPQAIEYLNGRGIAMRTAESLGLMYDSRQARVVFPVRGPSGDCFGYTGRAVRHGDEPKIRDYQGLKKRWHILGSDRWRFGEDMPLIIVEGLFGYAHLVDMGVEAVADVGALLGSVMTPQKADLIRQRNTNTVLLVDGDTAGDQCLFGRVNPDGTQDFHGGAVAMLENMVPLHVPSWPVGKDDPDQLSKREVWDILRLTPVWGEGDTPDRWL